MRAILYLFYLGINNATAEKDLISPFSISVMVYKKKSSASAVPTLLKLGQLYSAYMPSPPDVPTADNIPFNISMPTGRYCLLPQDTQQL